jgi:hypothetical protein
VSRAPEPARTSPNQVRSGISVPVAACSNDCFLQVCRLQLEGTGILEQLRRINSSSFLLKELKELEDKTTHSIDIGQFVPLERR